MIGYRECFALASMSWRPLFFASLALASAVAVACADSDERAPTTETQEGGAPPTLADAARDDDGGMSKNAGVLRVAHLADGLGAVDFCYQARGTGNLVGPVLGRASGDAGTPTDAGDAGEVPDAEAGDASDDGATSPEAGSPGVPYLAVSRYVTVSATGTLALSFVRPGSGSCADPVASGAVTIDPGKLVTAVLMGRVEADGGAPGDAGAGTDGGSPDGELRVTAFVDNRETVRDKARVRLVHAALGTTTQPPRGALAARAVSGRTTELASAIPPGQASRSSTEIPVDSLGYATVTPVPPPTAIEISQADDAGTAAWLSPFTDLGLSGGSLHTGFISSDGPTGLALLWCDDTSTSVTLGACKLLR